MPKKILLVDDDQYLRELYDELLKGDGFEVTTASDGEQGLKLASIGGYDLILLDVMLPKLDGIGILTQLEQNPPKTKNGLIVLLTNLSMDPSVRDSLKLGAAGFLVKAELTPKQFLEKIHSLLA